MKYLSPPQTAEFQSQVWDLVRKIPPGKVTTYSQIARLVSPPNGIDSQSYQAFEARWVGMALAACPQDVPWQRIINSQGKISPHEANQLQRQLLEAEGVQFTQSDKVDLQHMITQVRCEWVGNDPLYIQYHDTEWGVPLYDDQKLFEYLILEGMQAGLSWITILRKRDSFRKAFANFDPVAVARFGETEINALLQNSEIIRNRRKIEAAILNARAFLKIQEQFNSFSNYMWQFVDGKPIVHCWRSLSEIPAQTDLSMQFSQDLKQRGFRFVGPTIIYAHMQAVGMVNDHLMHCFRYSEINTP